MSRRRRQQQEQALSDILNDSSVREAAEKVSACFGDDLDACLQHSLSFLHKRYSRRFPTKIRLVEAALLLLEKENQYQEKKAKSLDKLRGKTSISPKGLKTEPQQDSHSPDELSPKSNTINTSSLSEYVEPEWSGLYPTTVSAAEFEDSDSQPMDLGKLFDPSGIDFATFVRNAGSRLAEENVPIHRELRTWYDGSVLGEWLHIRRLKDNQRYTRQMRKVVQDLEWLSRLRKIQKRREKEHPEKNPPHENDAAGTPTRRKSQRGRKSSTNSAY